jgi:hypothetical protein
MPTTLPAYMSSIATQDCSMCPTPSTPPSSSSAAPAPAACSCTCSAGVLCNLFAGPGWAVDKLPSRLEQGRLSGGGIVIGGAALTQTRRNHIAACNSDTFVLRTLTAAAEPHNSTPVKTFPSIYCSNKDALAPFGLGLPNFTAAPGIVRAFKPSVPPNGPPEVVAAFRAYFSAFDDIGAETAAGPAELTAAGWIDEDTASVQLSFAALHPGLGRVTAAQYTISTPRGGYAMYDTAATTFLLNPYASGTSTFVLDIFM